MTKSVSGLVRTGDRLGRRFGAVLRLAPICTREVFLRQFLQVCKLWIGIGLYRLWPMIQLRDCLWEHRFPSLSDETPSSGLPSSADYLSRKRRKLLLRR